MCSGIDELMNNVIKISVYCQGNKLYWFTAEVAENADINKKKNFLIIYFNFL